MKQIILSLLIFISISAFSQDKKPLPTDSLTVTVTVAQLQAIYDGVDAMHGDHVAIKGLLAIFTEAYNKRLIALNQKSDSSKSASK